MKNACKVLAGTLAPDPHQHIHPIRSRRCQRDRHRPRGRALGRLAEGCREVAVWKEGLALANDPLNLMAVDASTNRSKGDGDTASWLPPNSPAAAPTSPDRLL